ncbi:phosphatidylserine decarboxylase 1, partial [Tulasnella sp. 403]
MKPPFIGRRFFNLLPRRRPSATRVLRSFHSFYKRGDPNNPEHQQQSREHPSRRKKRFLYSASFLTAAVARRQSGSSAGRVAEAWYNTPTKWYPLPIGVGALLLAAIQYKKNYLQQHDATEIIPDEKGEGVKLKGPWQVHVLGALPLRNLSRLWGYLNSIELPLWLRPTGIRLYAWIFGCNLEEAEHSDLRKYASLGDFFYRRLKQGTRPIENASLVSPADGTILHFGVIDNHRIEQVKGLTYSLDALLGIANPNATSHQIEFKARQTADVDDREFANVNGIEYSLSQLLGSDGQRDPSAEAAEPSRPSSSDVKDASTTPSDSMENLTKHASVAAELGTASVPPLTRRPTAAVKPSNQLYFTVVYLAPGDYHRFHSPTAWVVERRRHFAGTRISSQLALGLALTRYTHLTRPGELFSVSPYIAKRIANLFVLNERVALLGRWRHGFFGMVPVGATNVGSIKVNFDTTLRTNLPARPPPPSPGRYAEATYTGASSLLRGQPLVAGQEMGGFCLGSTIVLVFEAPPNFEFGITPGQKVRVGQRL